MRNHVLPIFRLALIVLLLLVFSNCERDEIVELEEEIPTQTILDYEAKHVSGTTLFQENKDLDRHITNTFLSTDTREDQVNSPLYELSVDTANVQVITGDNFNSYTFIADRNEPTPNTLVNYVYTVFDDGGYTQMLINYPFTIQNGEIEYNFNQATAQYIIDDSLLLGESDSPCGSATQELIAWEGICIPVLCGDVGNHLPGQVCDDQQHHAYWQCSGAWVVTGCVTGGIYQGNTTDPTNSTTNGGGISTGQTSSNYPNSIPIVPKTQTATLLDIDGITLEMNEWLNNNLEIKLELQEFYNNNNDPIIRAIILELIELMREELTANLNVLKFIIEAIENDKYNNDIDTDFISSVHPYIQTFSQNNNPPANLEDLYDDMVSHFIIQCAVLRYNHPDWSNMRIFYVATKDLIHIQLDVLGLIPVLGEIADLTNGVLYTIEGDGINASLSFASAIPFVGWAAVGTKYAVKVASTVGTKVKLTWKLLADGTVYFGSNGKKLRHALGMASYAQDLRQAHHIIPWAKRNNNVVQQAAKDPRAFHMNEALNGIPLENSVHLGAHNAYTNRIIERLAELEDLYPNITPDAAYNGLMDIINDVRSAIQNNPTTHVNDLIF